MQKTKKKGRHEPNHISDSIKHEWVKEPNQKTEIISLILKNQIIYTL